MGANASSQLFTNYTLLSWEERSALFYKLYDAKSKDQKLVSVFAFRKEDNSDLADLIQKGIKVH
jgi:hypothetical protein